MIPERGALHKISENTALLLAVQIASSGYAFLLAAVLGRGLGDSGFGRYSLVMAWIGLLVPLTEVGLNMTLTRDLARRPRRSRPYLVHAVASKVLIALPLALALAALAPLLSTGTAEVTSALRWSVLLLLSGPIYSAVTSVLRAFQDMRAILWLTLGGQTALVAGTAALLAADAELATLLAWAGAVKLGESLAACFFYRRHLPDRGDTRSRRLSRRLIARLFVRSWPFAVAAVIAAGQQRLGILFLALLAEDAEVGLFAAAQRFAELGRILPGALYGALLPALATMVSQRSARRQVARALARSRLALFIFASAAVVAAVLFAEPVLIAVFGPSFGAAATALGLLVLGLVPGTQNQMLTILLYSHGQERLVNRLAVARLAIQLATLSLLAPRFGATGLAAAVMIAEAAVYLPHHQAAHRAALRIQPTSPPEES